ncbi:MAG TPA: NrfD/PsrC family molybdoenzyme membrane anchor subunit, partial [Pyrinomonadaceae bacterium]|nr:NrfD/PsrC family molybdoenzyme membrane anchor subunit [Pyrinomonadaceae bacterium]
LVLSVHTIVSFDFAVGIIPGWHATIFPPYFVAGAIYAGFAMVLTLGIPLRAIYKLHDFITLRHIEAMAKVTLVTGLVVVYGYMCEAFFGWYSGNEYERFMVKNRTYYGPYAWLYWMLLLRQRWRTSINRFAEAMTLFAVAQAGMYPIFHLGRPWLMYWLFPYPNTMGIWPQFRSPLMWDVFAVSTYATVSAMFWFVGLIPDFATLRDRARSKPFQILYGMLAMGWRGSARHWHRYEMAYLLLAGLATPLVLSVHTIVSFDFAVGIIPGWHATIFPPYFVAGAIYAGFAMVLLLTIPLRRFYGLEGFITMRHMHNMAKVMLATGLIVGYGYMMEAFFGWYSGNKYERFMIWNRMHGPYHLYYWALILCNIITPQFLWSKKIRSNLLALWIISFIVSIGMWLERFVIVVTSLHRDYLPSSWGQYQPTMWDWSMFIGTIGFFFTLLFLFIRFLPMISIFEMRTILPEAEVEE